MPKILVVEDEQHLADTIADWLKAQGYLVDCVHSGNEAAEQLKVVEYDLAIFDVNLPGMNGFQLCRQIRSRGSNTPVIFLTGNREIEDKESGFDAGADDYVVKPVHMRELAARVKALLRRFAGQPSTKLKVRDIELDTTSVSVTKDGVEVYLLPKEFALLEFLLRHREQVFSADVLIQRVWATDSEASPDTIRSYINRLRKKLDRQGEESMIRTVHGVGYKLIADRD